MRVFGLTDVGHERKDNQDSYAFRQLTDDVAVLVVCDGMGGAQAGSVASAVAVEAFSAAVEAALSDTVPDEPKMYEDILLNACQSANRQVYDLSRQNEEYRGMGTTLVAALILPKGLYVANVGDSRCYLIDGSAIRQITVDHSLVQLLVDQGEITAAEARIHPKKNLITRALGVDSSVECDVYQVDAEPGCRLLLCSDGLSNVLTDEMMALESSMEAEPEWVCRRLLNLTLEQGAPDNVTVVLAQL